MIGPDSPFSLNLAVLRGRLRRVRVPRGRGPSAGVRPRTVAAAVAALLVLVALSMAFVDALAWEWAKELPRETKDAFRFVTRFGRSDWLLIPGGVFGLALLAADFDRIRADLAAAWTEIGHAVLFFFVSIAGSGLVTDLLKILFGRTRPHAFPTEGHLVFGFVVFDSDRWSLPSGHATTAAAAAMAVVLIVQRVNAATVAVGFAALVVAVSRVPVRAHFASDVLVGIFVGAAVTWAVAWLLGRTGVAFQRQVDGALLPKTTAIRAVVARRGGAMTLLGGLVALGSGPVPPSLRPRR